MGQQPVVELTISLILFQILDESSRMSFDFRSSYTKKVELLLLLFVERVGAEFDRREPRTVQRIL